MPHRIAQVRTARARCTGAATTTAGSAGDAAPDSRPRPAPSQGHRPRARCRRPASASIAMKTRVAARALQDRLQSTLSRCMVRRAPGSNASMYSRSRRSTSWNCPLPISAGSPRQSRAALRALGEEADRGRPRLAQQRPDDRLRQPVRQPPDRAQRHAEHVGAGEPGGQRQFGRQRTQRVHPFREPQHQRGQQQPARAQPGEEVVVKPAVAAHGRRPGRIRARCFRRGSPGRTFPRRRTSPGRG